MDPNCLLFSQRERERESPKSSREGVVGGAMVLGKLSVPRRRTNLDNSRARAYCACSSCGWGCLDIFSLVYLFIFLSPSLGDGPGPIWSEILSQRAVKPKQVTNQFSREWYENSSL